MSANPEGPLTVDLRQFSDALAAEAPPCDPASPPGRILLAAREQFAATGYDAATTRAIAAAAGANQAMINYYFRSKEELYRRVLLQEFQGLVAALARALESRKTSGERLLEIPFALIQILRADPVRRRLVLREWVEGGPHARHLVENLGARGPRGLRALQRDLVLEAQREGEIGPHRPDAVLRYLLGAAYGFVLTEPILTAVLGETPAGERALRTVLDEHRRLVRDGLGMPVTRAASRRSRPPVRSTRPKARAR